MIRVSVRNIVINYSLDEFKKYNNKRIERLFVLLNKKYFSSQFNNGKDNMIKISVIFKDTKVKFANIFTTCSKSYSKKDIIQNYFNKTFDNYINEI